jgi:cytochrome c oxidase subunit 1
VVPADTQQHDSYYVVAHFHYVLFGGAVFGYVAGAYYWFPKWTGRMLDERLGKWHFWIMLIGFNLAFGPMHILGLNGMPRRTYRYPEGLGWEFWNAMATIGSFIIAISILLFLFNIIKSKRSGAISGPDPWDGRTLEWTIPSPPPEYNFAEVPNVAALDDFWHRKYAEDEEGRLIKMEPVSGGALAVDEARTGGDGDDEHGSNIHLPSPSYYPALSSLGIVIAGFGLVMLPVGWLFFGVGMAIAMWGLFGWSLEPVTKEH